MQPITSRNVLLCVVGDGYHRVLHRLEHSAAQGHPGCPGDVRVITKVARHLLME